MPLPPDDPPAGVPEWVLTFGDMMSLLLCFFILLASMSELRTDEKTKAIVESIMEQFADPEQLMEFRSNSFKQGMVLDAVKQEDPTNRKKAEAGGKGRPGHKMRVETIRDGSRHAVGGPVQFDPGEAVLTESAKRGIQSIATALQGKGHMIDVRGFENLGELPSSSPYKDATELAFARARAVAAYLTSDCGIRRDLIRVSIAAPIESAQLPRSEGGETVNDWVSITTTEASRRDFDLSTIRGR